jgi:hypothetical protein
MPTASILRSAAYELTDLIIDFDRTLLKLQSLVAFSPLISGIYADLPFSF